MIPNMTTTKRPIYKLTYGKLEDINTALSMNETHWKPVLMSAVPETNGVRFAVILENVGPEDGG